MPSVENAAEAIDGERQAVWPVHAVIPPSSLRGPYQPIMSNLQSGGCSSVLHLHILWQA